MSSLNLYEKTQDVMHVECVGRILISYLYSLVDFSWMAFVVYSMLLVVVRMKAMVLTCVILLRALDHVFWHVVCSFIYGFQVFNLFFLQHQVCGIHSINGFHQHLIPLHRHFSHALTSRRVSPLHPCASSKLNISCVVKLLFFVYWVWSWKVNIYMAIGWVGIGIVTSGWIGNFVVTSNWMEL
jgi:hypothetical protein